MSQTVKCVNAGVPGRAGSFQVTTTVVPETTATMSNGPLTVSSGVTKPISVRICVTSVGLMSSPASVGVERADLFEIRHAAIVAACAPWSESEALQALRHTFRLRIFRRLFAKPAFDSGKWTFARSPSVPSAALMIICAGRRDDHCHANRVRSSLSWNTDPRSRSPHKLPLEGAAHLAR